MCNNQLFTVVSMMMCGAMIQKSHQKCINLGVIGTKYKFDGKQNGFDYLRGAY